MNIMNNVIEIDIYFLFVIKISSYEKRITTENWKEEPMVKDIDFIIILK